MIVCSGMSTPRRATLFLIIGLAAASQSGNIIRLADAHPVALAAWRLLIASALLAPLVARISNLPVTRRIPFAGAPASKPEIK